MAEEKYKRLQKLSTLYKKKITRVKVIKTEKELEELIQAVKATGICSHDFETTAGPYHSPNHHPTCLGVSFQPGSAYIIPLYHNESPFKKDYIKILTRFGKEIMEDPKILKFSWNEKFERKWFMRYGIYILGRSFDGMLAKYLLDENTRNGLKEVTASLLPDYAGYDDDQQILVKKFGWGAVPMHSLGEYCGIDCDMTLRLCLYMQKQLIKGNFYPLHRNLLMMVSRALGEAEFEGMPIDTEYLDKIIAEYGSNIDINWDNLMGHPFIKKYIARNRKQHIKKLIDDIRLELIKLSSDANKNKTRITNLNKKLTKIAQGEFTNKERPLEELNLSSPKQIIDLLFTSKHGFRFKVVKYTTDKFKRPTKTPSTDESVLLELQNKDTTGFITGVLKHRELEKLYATYMTGVRDILSHDGKVHSSFLIHGTVTGRLSSKEPNLQNVPRMTTNPHIKPMFIPPPGYLLLEVDYSQAELRVVAEMAQDDAMLDIFSRGYNIHFATACKANGVLEQYAQMKAIYDDPNHPDNLHWVKQHKRAKLINFGILYGQTKKKLSIELDCSEAEAQKFIDQWFKGFPQIAKWIKKQHKLAAKKGYVISMFNRKRRLPDIWSDNFGKFLEAQRQSVNAPIQGTASDFTQFSSVVIREQVMTGELPPIIYAYTVHDSLGYWIKPEHIHKAVPKIVKICANPQTMEYFGFQMEKVNMKVSPEIGRNWGDLHDYDPWTNYKKWVAA